MRLLDMSSTACVLGLTDSHGGKNDLKKEKSKTKMRPLCKHV